MKSPQDAARKWARNMATAGESIKAGVNAVTESPTLKAARAIDRQVEGVRRAAESGKTERALKRVTLEEWRTAMLNKGLSRLSAGAAAAVGKTEAFLSEWMPYMEELERKLASMPRGTKEQNKARMDAAFEHNSNFRRRG